MVLVPKGEFIMGNSFYEIKKSYEWIIDNEKYLSELSNEIPSKKVFLDSYYIDIYEVSNKDWQECVDEGPCKGFMTFCLMDSRFFPSLRKSRRCLIGTFP